ncbi:Transcription factor, partial [Massospora cicadina]
MENENVIFAEEDSEDIVNVKDSSPKRVRKTDNETRKANKGRVDPRRKAGLTPNVAGNYRGKKSAEELLTEEQKKLHHIASEQKRRRNIKLGYDRLAEIIPTLRAEFEQSSCIPSETVILQRTVEYLKSLVRERDALEADIKKLQELNTDLPEPLL